MTKIRITKEQYDRLFKPLLENKINPNRVQKAFNKEIDEDEKITQEPLDLGFDSKLGSSASQKKIPMSKAIEVNVPVNEGEEKSKKIDMNKEVQSLVKFLYRQENELSDFLKEKGISFEDIKEKLKGKLIERNGKYELSKSCGTKEETYRTLENMLREMTGTYEEIEEDYPAGAEHDSSAPYNQKDIHVRKFPTDYEVISNDYKIAIVRDTTTNEFFLLDVYEIDSEFNDIQPEEITNHIENEGLGDAEPITLETIDNLIELYDLDKNFSKSMDWVRNELNSGNIEEMNSTGSVMGSGGVGTPSNSPVPKMGDTIERTMQESMNASPETVGPYAANALLNISRNGKFKKDGKKPKAFKVPQWAGGEMVEQPDCSKMNNNKEAQNGGCNSGASSLKTKKLSGSVNAPSIGENKNYSVYKVHKVSLTESMNMMKEMYLDEDLELRQVGDRIEVFSNNPDERKGGNETYKHKKMFSKKDNPSNFFDWDGNKKAWWTSIENRDAAVKLIDQINKSSFNATEDYTVDKIVQELEGLINDLKGADTTSCPVKTTCSPKEELDARIVAFMEDLIKETDSEKVAAKIKQYLDFRKNFHKYSLYNTMLIMLQRPNATRVAGMKTWNTLGRRVKAGTKAIGILKPIFPDNQDKNTKKPEIDLTDLDDLMNKAASYQPLKYMVVWVFDVSDTEGAELTQELQWWTGDDENEKAMKMVFFTQEFIKSLGIRLTNEASRGGERGYSADGIINIPDNVKGTGRLSTLVHELAHELLHWPKSKFYIGDEHKTDKAKLELQAESISYVVLRHYEMEQYSELNHANYLAGWGKGGDSTAGEKLRKELDVVTNVGKYIINGIDAIAEKSEKKNR
jgi:hypothetical protein